ncbi:MAG: hypothetical protein M3Q30_05145 [Actinomycetota bacterium]|nr:hypothetical protein [Actinomycetota bacterium]
MTDPVAVPVLVPVDRTRDFNLALGALVAGNQPRDPAGGSNADEWQKMSVVLATEHVARFYAAFGAWTAAVTTAAGKPALFDAQKLTQVWDALPRRELKFLSLCSDNFGRSVGWPELKRKLGLAGKPSLTRDLPQLAQSCTNPVLAFPIVQDGEGDDAVFTLPAALVDAVRALRRTGKLSATA